MGLDVFLNPLLNSSNSAFSTLPTQNGGTCGLGDLGELSLSLCCDLSLHAERRNFALGLTGLSMCCDPPSSTQPLTARSSSLCRFRQHGGGSPGSPAASAAPAGALARGAGTADADRPPCRCRPPLPAAAAACYRRCLLPPLPPAPPGETCIHLQRPPESFPSPHGLR